MHFFLPLWLMSSKCEHTNAKELMHTLCVFLFINLDSLKRRIGRMLSYNWSLKLGTLMNSQPPGRQNCLLLGSSPKASFRVTKALPSQPKLQPLLQGILPNPIEFWLKYFQCSVHFPCSAASLPASSPTKHPAHAPVLFPARLGGFLKQEDILCLGWNWQCCLRDTPQLFPTLPRVLAS